MDLSSPFFVNSAPPAAYLYLPDRCKRMAKCKHDGGTRRCRSWRAAGVQTLLRCPFSRTRRLGKYCPAASSAQIPGAASPSEDGSTAVACATECPRRLSAEYSRASESGTRALCSTRFPLQNDRPRPWIATSPSPRPLEDRREKRDTAPRTTGGIRIGSAGAGRADPPAHKESRGPCLPSAIC